MCKFFSELIYFANISIHEINDLEIITNVLNERFRKYKQLSKKLENHLKECKKLLENDMNKSISNDRYYEDKYNSAIIEINRLREESVVNEKKAEMLSIKEQRVFGEYESFKVIYLREIRNLKFDLEKVIKERDMLKDAMVEFKNYFVNVTNN